MFLSISLSLAAALLGLVSAQNAYGGPQNGVAGQVTYTNTRRLLFDVDGNQIDAYGSKVQYFNSSYYLYGNSFSTTGVAFGIKSYSSIDLKNWKFEGFLFDPSQENPCDDLGGCGRPHIVYNEKSKRYILWANAGSVGYVVATSSSPSGPFTFLDQRAAIDPKFDGLQPADFTTTVIDGKGWKYLAAYLSDSTHGRADFRITKHYPGELQRHLSGFDLIDQEAESPDLFLRNGWYYISASNTCGYCNGSIALLYRSKNIKGPWTRQIIEGYSCNGQVEGVLPLTDPKSKKTEYVWHSTSVPGGPRTGFGGHVFQPLKFNADGSVQNLDCGVDAKFTVPFTKGTAAVAKGAATSAGDGTPRDAVYTPVCDSDSFDLFQTFRASKSGTLKSISVNIARSSQTIPLALTFFKFSSYADLISPQYKWTTLGTSSTNATDLSYTFDIATVPVNGTSNAAVKAGDLLGLAIAGQDFAPYCHLEYENTDGAKVLYQRGAGQNSWRGLKGTTSPLYKREGKGVKFFVTYA